MNFNKVKLTIPRKKYEIAEVNIDEKAIEAEEEKYLLPAVELIYEILKEEGKNNGQ